MRQTVLIFWAMQAMALLALIAYGVNEKGSIARGFALMQFVGFQIAASIASIQSLFK